MVKILQLTKKNKPKKERQPNYEKKLAVKGSFVDLVKVAVKVDKPKKKSE